MAETSRSNKLTISDDTIQSTAGNLRAMRNLKEVKVEVNLWLPFIGIVEEVKPKKRHGWLQY